MLYVCGLAQDKDKTGNKTQTRNWDKRLTKARHKEEKTIEGKARREDLASLDKTGQPQDKTRQDKTRQDKTRQDKTRQDKTRQN
jgi:hypothetical protein